MHFVNYIILRSFINGIASTLIKYIFFVCWEKICFESIMWQSDIHEKNGTEEGSPHNQKIPIIKVLNYQGPDYWGSNLKTSDTLNPSDMLNVCNQQLWHSTFKENWSSDYIIMGHLHKLNNQFETVVIIPGNLHHSHWLPIYR